MSENKRKGHLNLCPIAAASSSSSSSNPVEGRAVSSSFLETKERRVYRKFSDIDAAITLVMISHNMREGGEKEESYDEDYGKKNEISNVAAKGSSRHVCRRCRMVFNSYQAFGGHKAGHSKRTGCATKTTGIKKK